MRTVILAALLLMPMTAMADDWRPHMKRCNGGGGYVDSEGFFIRCADKPDHEVIAETQAEAAAIHLEMAEARNNAAQAAQARRAASVPWATSNEHPADSGACRVKLRSYGYNYLYQNVCQFEGQKVECPPCPA